MRLLTVTCPLCLGHLAATPTSGRWECGTCRATLLVGKQEAVRHVVGKLQPPAWPHTEDPKPEPYVP